MGLSNNLQCAMPLMPCSTAFEQGTLSFYVTQMRPQGGPEGAGRRQRGCEARCQFWGRFQVLQLSWQVGTGDGLALICARLCEKTESFTGCLARGQVLTEGSSVFNSHSPAVCLCRGQSVKW